MKYTNTHHIPLPLAVFLATDNYDYESGVISTTSLLKPTRQLVLARRIASKEHIVDISDMVSSRMGTAIHTAIEQAWLHPDKALRALGWSDTDIKRVKVNPTEVSDDDIPVYMEQRSYKDFMGFKISGKFDFVADGMVQDFKSTSVYTYLNQSKVDDYVLQGSIYKWLNPEIITSDKMVIHYVFTDWNRTTSLTHPMYPKSRVLSQTYNLVDNIEEYITNKLSLLVKYENADEQDIPYCTDKELWRKPTVWKYYSKPDALKASKNFDNSVEAHVYMAGKGTGYIKEVKGTVSACKYCPAFLLCKQKDELINSGDLEL